MALSPGPLRGLCLRRIACRAAYVRETTSDAQNGRRSIHDEGLPARFTVLDFWQWSSSDLVSNALRGRIAEFLVARAHGVDREVRNEWDAYDLATPSGLLIEVKS